MSETRPVGYCKDCRVAPTVRKPDGSYVARCPKCAAKANGRQKAARAAAKAQGLCAWEGGCARKTAKGRRYCQAHLTYHRERMTPTS